MAWGKQIIIVHFFKVNNCVCVLTRVELLRSKFKRSTQKSRFMSTQNDYVLKVDIEERALQHLGQHKGFYFKVICVNLKAVVILCQPKARSSNST